MPRRDIGPIVLLAAIWGSSYLFIEIALRGFDPAVIVCCRQSIAAICLAPLVLGRGGPSLSASQLRWVGVVGVVMVGGPSVLVAVGQQSVSSSLAGILISATPILTVAVAAHFGVAERADRGQLAGIVLGMAGVVMLLGIDLSGSSGALLGGLALILASLGYAAGGALVSSKLGGVSPLATVFGASSVSAVLLLPVAAFSVPDEKPATASVLALVELGMLGTAAGWVLYYGLIDRIGPHKASTVQYLAPGFAVLLGVGLLGERLTLGAGCGLVLVVAGTWLATRRSGSLGLPPRP